MDWSKNFSGTRGKLDFVRRRKWVRTCKEIVDVKITENIN